MADLTWFEIVEPIPQPAQRPGWLTPQSNQAINNGAIGVGSYGSATLIDAIGSMHAPTNSGLTEGYANVAFADGHVKLHHISESKELATPKQFRPCAAATLLCPSGGSRYLSWLSTGCDALHPWLHPFAQLGR
jgi:prepilin-type processing-associated H-X9-DG protein